MYALPVLELDQSIVSKDYSEMSIEDFKVIFYHPMPSIKGAMAV
jgi:thymidylate synthase